MLGRSKEKTRFPKSHQVRGGRDMVFSFSLLPESLLVLLVCQSKSHGSVSGSLFVFFAKKKTEHKSTTLGKRKKTDEEKDPNMMRILGVVVVACSFPSHRSCPTQTFPLTTAKKIPAPTATPLYGGSKHNYNIGNTKSKRKQ